MNPYTKRSLIHLILSAVAIILGLAVFILISNSITQMLDKPVDEDAAFGEIGKFIAIFAGLAMVLIAGIIDTVFTSIFVYMFAYFSHENAKLAIDEGGDTTKAPRVLRVLSLTQMILAAVIALGGGLLMLFVFAFM
jgi:hypothetical protein